MPQLEPLEPPKGDISPYPMSVLELGDGRYLAMSGDVLDYPFGVEVQVQPNTRRFWEKSAARGGHTLDQLLGYAQAATTDTY